MAEASEREEISSNAIQEEHFDADSVRRILQHAAEEQHRLDVALNDAYSRAELEEMAGETGISPEALRVAIESERRQAAEQARAAPVKTEPSKGWFGWLENRMPASWSPPLKRAVLVSAGTIGLFWVLSSLPVVGPVVFWGAVVVLVVLSLLLLLGVSFV